MTLSFSILLIIYAIFIFLYLLFSFISVYHLIRTASFTTTAFLATFFVFAAGTLTIYGSWYLLRGTDWSDSIQLFNSSAFRAEPGTDPFGF